MMLWMLLDGALPNPMPRFCLAFAQKENQAGWDRQGTSRPQGADGEMLLSDEPSCSGACPMNSPATASFHLISPTVISQE